MKQENLRTVHLKFSNNEIKEIDDWKEQNRIRTRSEAIRQMIRCTIGDENSYGMADKDGSKFIKPSVKKDVEINEELAEIIKKMVNEAVKEALSKKD